MIYLGLNVAYSLGLKNIPLIDISILSLGFMLRVFYGATICGIGVSNWIYLTIFSGAMYLSLGKRRNELCHYGAGGRKVLEYYGIDFLDKSMQVFMTLCLVFYSLACTSYNTVAAKMGVSLIWTVPLVTLICLKYNLNIYHMKEGDPINIIFGDRWLLALVLIYMLSVTASFYLF